MKEFKIKRTATRTWIDEGTIIAESKDEATEKAELLLIERWRDGGPIAEIFGVKIEESE